jgi:hypothetical protein
MDYWHAAPQVTQPTQETEAGQGSDVTPQQAARDRHPPDNLTYPTEQIRRRKKGGPSKRAKGTVLDLSICIKLLVIYVLSVLFEKHFTINLVLSVLFHKLLRIITQ